MGESDGVDYFIQILGGEDRFNFTNDFSDIKLDVAMKSY